MSWALKALATRWPVSTASLSCGLVRCSPPAAVPSCHAQASLHTALLFVRPSPSLSARNRRVGTVTKVPRLVLAVRFLSGTIGRPSDTAPTSAASKFPPSSNPQPSTPNFDSAGRDSSKPPPGSSENPLDWETFFQLRLRRRRVQIVFSIITAVLGGAAGTIVLNMGAAEYLTSRVPLDPFFTLGLVTLACIGLGWLVGPSIGSQFFYLLNRKYKSQMLEKEKGFFARIRKNRVDPTNSSAGNPVPDFYGEKIQSVSGYRRWLKDQRAFNNKKKADFV